MRRASLWPSARPSGTAGCPRAFSRSPPGSGDQGGDPLTKTGITYTDLVIHFCRTMKKWWYCDRDPWNFMISWSWSRKFHDPVISEAIIYGPLFLLLTVIYYKLKFLFLFITPAPRVSFGSTLWALISENLSYYPGWRNFFYLSNVWRNNLEIPCHFLRQNCI